MSKSNKPSNSKSSKGSGPTGSSQGHRKSSPDGIELTTFSSSTAKKDTAPAPGKWNADIAKWEERRKTKTSGGAGGVSGNVDASSTMGMYAPSSHTPSTGSKDNAGA